MAAECLAAIHLCRVRATRLESDGSPMAGPNNVYVTDQPMVLSVTPVIQAGEEKTLVGGCDCLIADYKGYDKLKRFDLELDTGKFEIGLMEMLLGSSIILDGPDPIGQWWTEQSFDCGGVIQPPIALEGWQTAWDNDSQSPVWAHLHWVWPMSFWQIAAHSLQNDFNQPKLTGFTRQNSQWGEGIFGDYPEAAAPLGGFFYDNEIPDAVCGYQSFAVT